MDTKRRFIGLLAFLAITLQAFAYGDTRQEARFLTDKMMYELRLSSNQYLDVYEINYDFLASVSPMRNAIVHGDPRAMDSYYMLLDNRNQDLSWVLSTSQYRRYSGLTYFYRPVAVQSGTWNLRVYFTYTNHNHFYYGPPTNYRSYNGRYHRRNGNHYYYRDRYRSSNNRRYRPIHNDNRRSRDARREDFGYRDQRRESSSSRNNSSRNHSNGRRNEHSRDTRSNSSVSRPSTVPTYRVSETRREPTQTRDSRSNNRRERVSTSNSRSSSRGDQSRTTSRRRANSSSSSTNNQRTGQRAI